MLDEAMLKEALVTSGKIDRAHIEEAEAYAKREHVPLARVLTSRLMIGFEDLGKCCASITGLPYVSLMQPVPPREALGLLSPVCARQWKTLPVAFDAHANRLTLAVGDPAQIPKLKSLHQFLMQPHGLDFTIAPEGEIERPAQNTTGCAKAHPPAAGRRQHHATRMSGWWRRDGP